MAGFYRDIAVQAFPTVGDYRIPDIASKAAFQRRVTSADAGVTNAALTMVIEPRGHRQPDRAHGRRPAGCTWDVPPGEWTILRLGHTSTGAENAPAPATGRGLECDKLSKEGIEANFAGMMAKLAADTGLKTGGRRTPAWWPPTSTVGRTVRRTGRREMREEFQQRRGYDLLPFLPVMTGRVVGSLEISERFLWDLRQTVSELVIENYAGRMRELAHAHGMRFTVEAYGGPCDSIPYAGESDEPMGEFWTPSGAIETCRGMASAGHVYGKRIIGAEAFTSGDQERWLEHPALLKAHGDRRSARASTASCFTATRCSPGRRNASPA